SSSLAPSPTTPDTLSLHDALPILRRERSAVILEPAVGVAPVAQGGAVIPLRDERAAADAIAGGRLGADRLLQTLDHLLRNAMTLDRKSTRLNSSHRTISYAVFCLK